MLRYGTGMLALLIWVCSACAGRAGDDPTGTVRDEVLEEKLKALTDGFRGQVGVYVRHLDTGRTAAVNADRIFPTASMVKVPIAVKLFDRVREGELDLKEEREYDPDDIDYPPGRDLLAAFRTGETIEIGRLVMLMLSLSDNTASLWCQELAGGGTAINAWLESNGFVDTRVNSRTEGRQGDWEAHGWGQTTPREMAELLVRIRRGEAAGGAADEKLYRMLTRTYWDETAVSRLPPWIQAATKQGAVSHARSEVVLVNAPSGDYVFCVATRDQEDRSWEADNEGFVLLREVSEVLWEYFEPEYGWTPAGEATP